jgi:hypothetical protein
MAIMASGQLTLVDINDSKQLQAYLNSSQPKTQIFNPNGSTYTPHWPTSKPVLTPQMFIAGTSTDIMASAKSTKWFIDGVEITASTTDYTLAASGIKTLTINTNVLAAVNSKLFTCEVVYTDTATNFDVSARAEIEFVKVSAGTNGAGGANAITAVLSNETDSVPADSAGASQIITGVTSTVTVYEGATDVTASWAMGTPVVVGLGALNTAYTLTGTPANRIFTLIGTNPMTADTASVTWTLTRAGYANIIKKFTISRIRNGVAGTSPTLYRLIPSTNAIQKNVAGVYNPTTLTVSGKSQTGTGAYGNYSGRYIIADSPDGVTFTDRYNGTVDEASKVYTPLAGIKAIRVRMYLAGGVVTMLDEQIIPIVQDGATGADAVRAIVWTPDGNTIRNATGTLKAQCDVFSGSTLVTPSAFKWYLQDPAATTVSGGDVDGGNGWRLINVGAPAGTTGYTTGVLTITAASIIGVESFKCIPTYNAIKYSDVCTLIDVSDPIQVSIIGSNVFKNGQGVLTLIAKLFQASNEIDAAGSVYIYTWSLYDSANVKKATWNTTGSKLGKTITVDAVDVTGSGNILCEISK